ncbi:MAG TPA: biofilm regulation phosphoprotein SiaC [Azospira sp.]|nr:biofilm regulation phosphoprotein SiaC [Azospira sp.]
MDNLNIPQTNASPAILADWSTGVVTMKGDSYPENSFELFQPLIDWVTAFLKEGQRPLRLELELLYLNTSSIRALMDILDLMEEAHRKGLQVATRWSYEAANERVGQLAEEFKEDCTFPFDIVPKA